MPASSPVHLGNLNLPGPHPAAWGPGGVPPGSQGALSSLNPSASQVGTNKSNNWSGSLCQGLYPGGPNGQQYYVGDCYGHDEPSIMWYSTLPGSGGNVTWSVTLPTDRAATQNQTDLYVAIWFGLALYDPYGLWHQCFLELQFYPDQTWYNPGPMFPSLTVNGAWIAAAVGWEINVTTGFEDPCYYQPLYLNGVPGPTFLNMTQGDQVKVAMKGFPSSTVGEQIWTNDTTNGQKSINVLYNKGQHYPLNPVYAATNSQDDLQWGLGGQYAVSFSYETGHTWSPAINTNGYGGCNPGLPGAPSTPCGTFDPGSWANDTLTPWLIKPPVFSNAAQQVTGGAQVAFEQDFGGIAQVNGLSYLGSCTGMDASAWCSYPWYSYSCTAGAFEFGATNYPGVSNDFGKYTQFHYQYLTSSLGVGFSIPTNFTMPTCGGPTSSLSLMTSGGGSVDFLSTWMNSGSSVSGLAPGNYSVNAVPPAGMHFSSWTGSSGVAVADVNTPWTSVQLSGAGGTLTANFAAVAVTSLVTLVDVGGVGGQISVTTYNFTFAPLLALGGTGTAVSLPGGIYSIQAYPPDGYNFTYWSVTGGTITAPGNTVSPGFPITNLIVSGGTPATVTAHYAATTFTCLFTLVSSGPGTATLGGLTDTGGYSLLTGGPTYNFSTTTLPVGMYTLTLSAPAGWYYYGLAYGFPGTDLTDQHGIGTSSVTIHVALEASATTFTFIEIFWTEGLTFADSPAAGGQILGPTGAELTSGNSISSPGPYLYTGYMVAQPATGYVFSSWTNSTALIPFNNHLDINTYFKTGASGTITANYAAAAGMTSLTFNTVTPAGGTIWFNGAAVKSAVNGSVATGGVYFATQVTNPDYTFTGWSSSGGVTFSVAPWNYGIEVKVTSAGYLNATFAPALAGISFVPSGIVSVTATVNGVTMASDHTQLLVPGTSYPLVINAAGYAFETWDASTGITIANPTAASTTFTATGAGTIYALVIVAPVGVTATPNPTEVGVSTTISATVSLAGSYTYAWTALPTGCVSANSLSLSCVPTTGGTFNSVVTLSQGGFSFPSVPGSIVVDVGLAAAVAAAPGTIDLGQSTTLTATVSNGMAPVSDSWTGLPAGCTSSNTLSLPCTPTASGSFTATFTGTDALGVHASASVALKVNPAVTVSLAVSAASVVNGTSVTFTATTAGGSGTYTYGYTGLPAGCTTATGATLTCTPTSVGTVTVTVKATDGLGQSASSNVQLTVTSATPGGGGGGGGGGKFLGLPTTEGYALLAGIIILIAAIIVAIALLMRRKKDQGPPPTGTMDSMNPTSPGSPPGGGGSQ